MTPRADLFKALIAALALLFSVSAFAAPQDFNGDGKSEMVWRNRASGENAIWQLDALTLARTSLIATVADPNWNLVGSGDFDGDSKSDLLWRNVRTGEVAVWLMDGFAIKSAAVIASVAPQTAWGIVATGDFDGDGNADILWRNQKSGELAVWLLSGITLARSALLPAVLDSTWSVVGVADVNGDRKADIVWRNTATGDNAIWLVNGTTLTSTSLLPRVSDAAWSVVGAADFNADGKADILWRNQNSGENAIWLMDGSTMLGSRLIDATPPGLWDILATGDFDGDGKADIVWRHATTGDVAVWLMDQFTLVRSSVVQRVDPAWSLLGGSEVSEAATTFIAPEPSDRTVAVMNMRGGHSITFSGVKDANGQVTSLTHAVVDNLGATGGKRASIRYDSAMRPARLEISDGSVVTFQQLGTAKTTSATAVAAVTGSAGASGETGPTGVTMLLPGQATTQYYATEFRGGPLLPTVPFPADPPPSQIPPPPANPKTGQISRTCDTESSITGTFTHGPADSSPASPLTQTSLMLTPLSGYPGYFEYTLPGKSAIDVERVMQGAAESLPDWLDNACSAIGVGYISRVGLPGLALTENMCLQLGAPPAIATCSLAVAASAAVCTAAKIFKNGKFLANQLSNTGPGTLRFTASHPIYGVRDTGDVNYNGSSPVPSMGIPYSCDLYMQLAQDYTTVTLHPGQTLQLSPVVRNQNDLPVIVPLDYSSNHPEWTTVSQTGLVTAGTPFTSTWIDVTTRYDRFAYRSFVVRVEP